MENPQPARTDATESPRADQMKGANGLPHYSSEDDPNPGADQEIDTAGTDMDDLSPTRAMGTGLAPSDRRG